MDTFYKIVILILCIMTIRFSFQIRSLKMELMRQKLRIEEVRAEKMWEETVSLNKELIKDARTMLGIKYDNCD